MKTLYMIRHSITEGNVRRLYYGSTDLPLNETGRELCRSLKGKFHLPEDVLFATSGMLRAEETLRLIFGDIPHQILPDLREMDMGDLEMRCYNDVKDWPPFQDWLSDTTGTLPLPNGESNQQVHSRVTNCISNWARTSPDSLFIVCHGGSIAYTMVDCFPDSGKTFYDWIPHACQGFAVEFENARPICYRPI